MIKSIERCIVNLPKDCLINGGLKLAKKVFFCNELKLASRWGSERFEE